MAYRCKSCKKVARGKRKKTASTLLKKHCCPGCGSFELDLFDDDLGLIYDFEELGFELIDVIDNDNFSEEISMDKYEPTTPAYEPPEQTASYGSESSSSYGSDSSDCGSSNCSSCD